MRLDTVTDDLAPIERLAKAAHERPRVYRAKLAMLAIAGDIVLTFVRVMPWLAMPIFGALWYNQPLFYWAVGAAALLLIWIDRPTARVGGTPLERKHAPALFAAIDRS